MLKMKIIPKLPKPKFNIGEKVIWWDNFHRNPAYGTIFISTIKSIRIYTKKGLYQNEDVKGKITYDLHGCNLVNISEENLYKYKEEYFIG